MSETFINTLKSISLFSFLFLVFLCSPRQLIASDFTATTIDDYGNITVMEVEGNYDAKLPDGTINEGPRQTIAKEFFRLHKDEYDFLVIFTNFDFKMPEAEAEAFYHPIKNDVKGIGIEIFDNSGLYGSGGKLQGIIDMGNINKKTINPLEPGFEETLSTLSHELLHRWAAHIRFMDRDGNISTALLGKDEDHWSYLLDTDGSVLYGNDWQDNGDGTFTSVSTGKYYSPLDLYLMGFVDRTRVPPMLLIDNPSIDPAQPPEKGVTITGEPQYVTIDDIIAVEGERVPDASSSSKSFRMAFIVLTLPGTFRVEDVYKLEDLRDEWIKRFSVLTDGKGLVEVSSMLKEELPENPGVTPPDTRPRTIPPDIEDGVKWLMRNQEMDGSWITIEQTVDRDTAEAVLALKNFTVVAEENYLRGLQWLNSIDSGNMDYLVRKVMALTETGRDVTPLIDEILSRQNSDGGWGSNYSYMSNPVDTSFGLLSLAVSGYRDDGVISKAIDYLRTKQNVDGGWGSSDEESTVQATSNVLMAFSRYRQMYKLDGEIQRAIEWLLAHQNPDGGFGNSPSTVYDTAVAVLALRELNVSTDITNRALNYLLLNQGENGSWNESPYQTALAIKAVWKATIDPDLAIRPEDVSFSPAAVTRLPEDVVINAIIWNLGRTDVPQTRVVLYEGSISDTSKVAEQVVALPGQASTTVTFSVNIQDGKGHTYYIVVDPDGSVKESNEQNNTATRILYPEPTHDFEILSSDLSLSSNTVSIFDEVTITSKVTNRGTSDAYNVQLRYFIDDPDAPYEIATLTVDIPAGTTITSEYTWRTDRAGTDLPVNVEADPFDVFTELSEDNNRATAYLNVEESTKPNLTVSYKDIVITPSPAQEAGNATVSVLVKNDGFSPASDIKVAFYKGTPGVDGVLIGKETIDSISPGESKNVSMLWQNIMDSGERIIYVQVDPDNLITEIKEDDNDAFRRIKILSLPDLAISTHSIVFSPSAPKEGDNVSINVVVKNLGQQAVSDVTVEAYENGTLIDTGIIPLIPGSSEAMVSFPYDTSGRKGSHEITIKVDPDNLIAERSKDNNQASRVMAVQDADLWLSEPYISPNGDGVKDSTDFFFRLETPQTVKVVVVDEKGNPVRVFSGPELTESTGTTITWEGLDSEGRVVADGQYRIEVVDMDDNILGGLLVVVDNNRSPLTDAIGTEYFLHNNLTCMLPQIDSDQWQWLPDESAIVFSIKSSNTDVPEYPAGVYTVSPDGEDIQRLIPWDWTEENLDAQYENFESYPSPDGMNVLVSFSKKEGNNWGYELWMVDSYGGHLRFILGSRYINDVIWAPDSRSFAVREYGNLIWIINRETLKKTQIEAGDFYVYSLRWSLDGKMLAYIAGYYDQDGNYTEEVRITDLSGNKESIQLGGWHSDLRWLGGNIVSFESDKQTSSNKMMWLIKLGENGTRVKITDSWEEYALSPDKKQMAIIDVANGNISIKKIDNNGDVSVLHTAPDYSFLRGEIQIRNIQNLLWSSNGRKIAFVEYKPSEMIEGCPPLYAPYLIVIDTLTMKKKTFKIGEARCDYSYECSYSGKPECYIFPGEFFNGLESFFKDSIHIIAEDSKGYFVIDTETGEKKGYIPVNSWSLLVSPHGRYITYYKTVDKSSICYGRGDQDIWALSSLLNLTAELRTKKERTGIILKGIATDLNFESYKLEYADVKNPDNWSLIKPPSDVPVVNDVFTAWVPPYEGRFYVRLTARDRAGNSLQSIKQVSWGLYSSITSFYKTEDIFSPNGDGVKDTVELHYRVLEPVHLEFYIYDKDNNLIRTFYRDYSTPQEAFITWDGRDEGGSVVPDGVYKIKVLDYEFFVEVDTTLPDAGITVGVPELKFGVDRMKRDRQVVLTLSELKGHAVDPNLKEWVVEYGEGDNPEEWFELAKGFDSLVGKDENGQPSLSPVADALIRYFIKDAYENQIEWLFNRKFRITAEDFGGNRRTVQSGFLEETIVINYWDGKAIDIIDNGDISVNGFPEPGVHYLGGIETVRLPLKNLTLQYATDKNITGDPLWIDAFTVENPASGIIRLEWDSSMVTKGIRVLRLKANDLIGHEYYSNRLIFEYDEKGVKPLGIGLQKADKKEGDCGVLLNNNTVFSLDIQYYGNSVTLLTLSYYIDTPEGDQLLREIDIQKEGLKPVEIDTSGLPDGEYNVKAVLKYKQSGTTHKVTATDTLIVDHSLPTAEITYPEESLMICPVRQSTGTKQWYGIPVEGVATDNQGVKRYELFYGVGNEPPMWYPAMTVNREGEQVLITGYGAKNGQIGLWDVTGIKGEELSLRLKVVDIAGNVSCTDQTFSVDTGTEITYLDIDKPIFSPNGDGVMDTVNITYRIDEYANVDVQVYRLNRKPDGSYAPGSSPVRTIASGLQHLGGTGEISWDGRDDSGAVVPDGEYAVAVIALDSCGNTIERWVTVEVDNTPPEVTISYPASGEPLGNIVEVKGTASDSNFNSFTLEAGEGDTPDTWTLIGSVGYEVEEGILGRWNISEHAGTWTLRLSASDTVGNRSETEVTVDLGIRENLVKDLKADPSVFSPNNDERLDRTNIIYELTDACNILMEISDQRGTTVHVYETSTPSAGVYQYTWDGLDTQGLPVPDGLYTVRLKATLANNTSVKQEEKITVVVDTKPPIIDIRSPLENSYLSSEEIYVTGTITDENILEYSIELASPEGTEVFDAGTQSRQDYNFGVLNGLSEGRYTLKIRAEDRGENITEKDVVFTIDRTPPEVALDTPKEGELYGADRGSININGSIAEENIESYMLRYGQGKDPVLWTELLSGDTLPQGPLSYTLQTGKEAGIPDGIYTVSLYAKDRAGFEREARVTVTVDNTPPEVIITSPAGGDYVKEPVDVTGTVQDLNLDKYTVEISEGKCAEAYKWAVVGRSSVSVQEGVLTRWQALPSDGNYCLRVTAKDKLGQQSEARVDIRVDTHPPQPPVLSGEIENRTDARLSWIANTEPDLAGYNLYRDGQKLNSELITEIQYIDSSLSEGNYTYTVRAVDRAGWESEPSNQVKLRVDLTGPSVKIGSPRDGSPVRGVVDIKGTAFSADDFREYRLYIGAGPDPDTWNLIRRSPLPIPYGILSQWDTTGLEEGRDYSIKLEAEDTSGNINEERISVIIDNTPPSPPVLLSVVADGADVTVHWQANTEPDLAGYLLYRNEQIVNAGGMVAGDLTPYLIRDTQYEDKGLPDGKFMYYLVAVDEAGNMSEESNAIEVAIDTRPPHMVIDEPEDGEKFEKTIVVRADSPDLDISQVQFEYKGSAETRWVSLGSAVTRPPYVIYLNPEELGLTHGEYNLRAVATDEGGNTDPSPEVITVIYTDITPPEPPTDLRAQTDGRDVTLSWTASTETDLQGYNIYRIEGDEKVKLNSTPLKDTVFYDRGLADGRYTYVVTAIDIHDNESRPSSPAEARVYAPVINQPYTPTGDKVIQINGEKSKPDVTVEVFVDAVSQGTTRSDENGSFTFNVTLAPGENRITARATDKDRNTSRLSEPVVLVYNEPPAAPTGLVADVQDYNVTLSWTANTEPDLWGYNLYRDGEKLNKPFLITTGSTAASSSYSYSPPSNAFDSNYYTYWVSPSGNGRFSPAWWEITLPSSELINRIEIYWGSASGEGEGDVVLYAGRDYEIQVWSGYAWITEVKVTGNTDRINTFDLRPSYRTDRIRIYITDTTDPNSTKQVRLSEVKIFKDNLIEETAYEDQNLGDGRYLYTLTAIDYYGFESQPSDGTGVTVGDIVPPSPPQGLTAMASGADVVLNWTANTEPDLAGYNIYRKTTSGEWIKINPAIVQDATYTDPGLPNGNYTYRITALDKAGNESGPSVEASVTVNILRPAPPLSLTITAPAKGASLIATWQYPGTAAGFNLYRASVSGGPYTRVNNAPVQQTSYTDRGLTNGRAYYYVVVAVDTYGNESTYSNEAMGVPADTIAPPAPVLYYPAITGRSIRLYRNNTDIAGWAEPGAVVELFRNGIPVGSVVSEGEAVTYQYALEGSISDLSPDGKRAVYTRGGSIYLMDLETGAEELIVQGGYSPLWSPDGNRIAYMYLDENRSMRIGIYDIQTGEARPLTDDQFIYETDPSWSAVGNRVAFVSNREDGRRNVWIKDMETGSLQRVSDLNNASGPALSPDGNRVAYFEGQTLYIADLSTDNRIEVDTLTDGSTLSWAPEGKRVAFVSYRNGNADIFVLNIESGQQTQIAGSVDDELLPGWSPDGSAMVFVRPSGEGGSLSLWRVEIPGQEELIQEGINSTGYISWVASGAIGYADRDALYILYPEGHFRFHDTELEPGENIFYAIASDTSGNTGPPSGSISVVFDTSRLPDLEVKEDDIYIYPPYPIAGDRTVINVVVWNRGGVDASNVDVDLYMQDALGGLELIKTETIPDIPAGSAGLVMAEWDSTDKEGDNRVIVVLDPEDRTRETRETNNYTIKEFHVASQEGLSLKTTIDSTEYRSMQDMRIDLLARNSGPEIEGTIKVWVEDADGYQVALIREAALNLPYGYEEKDALLWNTGPTYAGQYRVHTIVLKGEDIIAEDVVPFTIVPDIRMDTLLTTDRASYGPAEDVSVVVGLRNTGRNYIIPEATLRIKILDLNNNELFAEEHNITGLLPGTGTDINSVWNTGLSNPGEYRAVAETSVDGEMISGAETIFRIEPKVLITGRIVSVPSVVRQGSTLKIGYRLYNSGNTDARGLTARILIIDSLTQRIMDTKEASFDLPLKGSKEGEFVFSTGGYALRKYMVVLQGVYKKEMMRLNSASFTVMDGTPPLISIISPERGSYYNSRFDIVVTAADDASGVDRVEYRIDRGGWKRLPLSDPLTGRYSTAWAPVESDEGVHTIYFRATDGAGNTGMPVSTAFTIDLTPPEPPRIVSPVDGTYLSSETVDIKGVAEPGAVVEMGFAEVVKTTADPATGEFIFKNINLLPGKNIFLFSAKDRAGNVSDPTRYILYLGRLDVTKTISQRPRTLVWIPYEKHKDHEESDDHGRPCKDHRGARGSHERHGHRCGVEDSTIAATKGFIEEAIEGTGAIYEIVNDEEEFMREFRSGLYNTYIIVDLHRCRGDDDKRGYHECHEDHHGHSHLHPELQAELAEAVFRGEGIIFIKTSPSELPELRDALGVKFRGKLRKRREKIALTESEITEEKTVEFYGLSAMVRVTTGAIAGTYGKSGYPAVVLNGYGRGSSVLFTFNPVDVANRADAVGIFSNALNYIAPDETGFHPHYSMGVDISVKARYADFDLKVVERIPEELRIEGTTGDAAIDGNTITWKGQLQRDTSADFFYIVRLPDLSGEYRLSTDIYYLSEGVYKLYKEKDTMITIDRDRDTLTGDIISELGLLDLTGRDRHRLREAIRRMERVRDRVVRDDRDAERNIRDILKAIKSIKDIRYSDTDLIKRDMDTLLRIWEIQWYLMQDTRAGP